MIRKQNSLIADLEKVLDRGSYQPQHFLKSKPNPEQDSISLKSVRAERGEEAAEEKSEVNRCWFINLKERSHLHKVKVQGEAASVDADL